MTEFEGWLAKGLGCAAVFLRNNDGQAYRPPLLYACTHDLTYDRQCEDRRGYYLLALIAASHDEEFYRDAILAALQNGGEDLDFAQIFEIAGDYARQGDGAMKAAMYAAFRIAGYVNMGICAAEELVRLDGLDALLFVAKSFGEEEASERPWQFRRLLAVLEERDGSQALPPDLTPLLVESREEESRHLHSPTPQPTEAEISAAAESLLQETDALRLSSCLRLFRTRVFPGPIDRLLSLVPSEEVSHWALAALSNIRDARVRALGLAMIQEGRGRGIGLLVHNPGPGDYAAMEELLRCDLDPNEMHLTGMAVRDYARANQPKDAESSLLFLYEHGPCSLCRRGFVELLIEIGRLPAWMAEECHFDALFETRKLVSSLQ